MIMQTMFTILMSYLIKRILGKKEVCSKQENNVTCQKSIIMLAYKK